MESFFFFSSRRRHTRCGRDWSSDVCSSDLGSAAEAGSVNVLHGSASGLTSTGSQQFWQGAAGVAGMAEAGDFFGASLAAGDFNNDGFAELAIGAPVEALGSIVGAGSVNVLHG